MTERHAVTSLDELVAYEIPGQARWHMIRSRLDVKSFGINAWTATEDDQQVIGEHDEADGAAHEELYVVITGHATFTLDGESADASAGTVVHVPDPSVKRGAVARKGTTILAVGAKPGEAYTPSRGTSPRRLITGERSTTSPARMPAPAEPTSRSTTFGVRSSTRSRSRRMPGRTRTSRRSATIPASPPRPTPLADAFDADRRLRRRPGA